MQKPACGSCEAVRYPTQKNCVFLAYFPPRSNSFIVTFPVHPWCVFPVQSASDAKSPPLSMPGTFIVGFIRSFAAVFCTYRSCCLHLMKNEATCATYTLQRSCTPLVGEKSLRVPVTGWVRIGSFTGESVPAKGCESDAILRAPATFRSAVLTSCYQATQSSSQTRISTRFPYSR